MNERTEIMPSSTNPETHWANYLKSVVEAVRARERALMEFVRGPAFTFEGLRERMLK